MMKPSIKRWSRATSGRRFQESAGKILSVDQIGMGWGRGGGVIAD